MNKLKQPVSGSSISAGSTLLSLVFIIAAMFTILSIRPTLAETNELEVKSVPDPATESLSKTRGISFEQAKQRIAWQGRASDLSGQLEQALTPEEYGGVWIGADDDRVKVGMVSDSKQQPTVASRATLNNKVANLNLQKATDIIAVTHSYSELQGAVEWVAARLGASNKGNEWPIQAGITTDTNQVMLSLPPNKVVLSKSQENLIENTQVRYGDMVRVGRYMRKPQEANCNFQYCDSPLRGGVRIIGSDDNYSGNANRGSGACTLGFIARGNSGQLYTLTTGHCEPAGNGWGTRTAAGYLRKIGPVHRSEYRTLGVDAMIVEISNQYNWYTRGWIYIRDGFGVGGSHSPSLNTRYPIVGTGTSGSLVGQRVCMSGSTTGSSCGPVKEVNVYASMDGIITSSLVRAFLCGDLGDSGGPVIRENKALGIYRGGARGTCSSEHYYTGIQPIIRKMDNTIDVVRN